MADTKNQGGQNGNGSTPPGNGTMVQSPAERTIADSVMTKIKLFEETGTLSIPKGYSAPNALRVAWLILQDTVDAGKRPVLEVCTKESIANALLKMIIQGLNPVKRQCSFVAYGNKLTCQREYNGAIAIARRDAGLADITGNAVFKDDVFKYTIDVATGIKTVTEHEQTMDSMMGEVKGAYAIKTYEDGRKEAEIMTINQIRAAWAMGQAKGDSPAHRNFPDQMAVKTVINRALKIDINSSDDSALLGDAAQETDDPKMAGVKLQIAENANKTPVGFEDAESETVPSTKQPEVKVVGKVAAPAQAAEKKLETVEPGF